MRIRSLITVAIAAAVLGGSNVVCAAAPTKKESKKPAITWVCDKKAKPPEDWAKAPECSAPGPLKWPCEKAYCKLVPKVAKKS